MAQQVSFHKMISYEKRRPQNFGPAFEMYCTEIR